MNAPHISKANFAALLELAESRFHAWRMKELSPAEALGISDLKKQNLTSAGRAFSAIRIYRELLEREVRERIGFYSVVARESGSSDMLSERCLEEYRHRIMTTVLHATAALRDHAERDVCAAGDGRTAAMPNENQYVQLQAEIQDVVNTELRVLEAEGKLAGAAATSPSKLGQAKEQERERNATAVRVRRKPQPGILPTHGTVPKGIAATALGCSIRTVERYAKDKLLTPITSGNSKRYKASELKVILDSKHPRQTPTK